MAATSWFRYTYLARLSRPKSVRRLYRLVKRHRVHRIVEVGIGDIGRALALIEVAQRYSSGKTVCYTGIDWFETRSESLEPLSLKATYQLLRPTQANVRLVPGPPGGALSSIANAHQNTDLILISHAVANSDLAPAWFYVPRMLHERTLILREQLDTEGESEFTPLTSAQVSIWADSNDRRRAA